MLIQKDNHTETSLETNLYSHDLFTGELVLEYTAFSALRDDGWWNGYLYDERDAQRLCDSTSAIPGLAQFAHDRLIQHANTLHRTRQNRINSLVMQARKGVRC